MRTARIVRLGALGVMLGALSASPLAAQETTDAPAARPAVETFYTQIRFDGNQGRMNANGIGARLMWHGPSLWETQNALTSRLDLGLFGSYTPKRPLAANLEAATYHVGAVADLRAFGSPWAGRLDPFATLGAGVLSTHVNSGMHPAPSPLFKDSQSSFTLAPGIGTRLLVVRGLAVQGDVRDVMTFIDGTRHNPAVSAGLRWDF